MFGTVHHFTLIFPSCLFLVPFCIATTLPLTFDFCVGFPHLFPYTLTLTQKARVSFHNLASDYTFPSSLPILTASLLLILRANLVLLSLLFKCLEHLLFLFFFIHTALTLNFSLKISLLSISSQGVFSNLPAYSSPSCGHLLFALPGFYVSTPMFYF